MRLIDADALKDKLQQHHDFYVMAWGGFGKMPIGEKKRVDEITNCIAEVVNAPTIEPNHGEWIDKGWKGDWQFETDGRGNCWHEYECSECGFHSKGSKSNFCPNCGADMRNCSEKPNNCDTCRNKGFEGCEQPCLGCGCCGLYEPNDEPRAERIKTLDYCDICNHKGCDNCIANNLDDYCVPSGYEPITQTETQNSNLTFEKDECVKEYEELGLKELKELINADRKTENCSEKPNNCAEPQTEIPEYAEWKEPFEKMTDCPWK